MMDALPEHASAEAGPSRLSAPRPNKKAVTPITSYAKSLEERVTIIKEGDTVMLEMPSEVIKIVKVTSNGITSLGKFGAFPTSELIGRHYNITYEIAPSKPAPMSGSATPTLPDSSTGTHLANEEEALAGSSRGQALNGRRNKDKQQGKQGKGKNKKGVQTDENSAKNNVLRPRRKARIQELEETDATNELIDDNPSAAFLPATASGSSQATPDPASTLESDLPSSLPPNKPGEGVLSASEIAQYRAQGLDYEDMIALQMDRHERFGLKTEYSKEKWRKRKEKKYGSFVTPLAPTLPNIIAYYNSRPPSAILSIRIDTMSQLLNLSAVRPGGRYLVVDDTSGLLVAAMLERMGGHGQIMLLTENDSPPAWALLEGMNFDRHMLERSVKWLNWYEAQEDYQHVNREELPKHLLSEEEEDELAKGADEDEAAAQRRTKALSKERAKDRRRKNQEAELDTTRDELHRGNWDGLLMACEISPPSVLSRLTPYLAGSATVTVYSQYSTICAETLQYMRERDEYLAPAMTESWMRRYQVLPMRTHPTMTTSATGGFLVHAIRIYHTTEGGNGPATSKRKGVNGDDDDPAGKRQKLLPTAATGLDEDADSMEGGMGID